MKVTNKMQRYRLIYYSQSALHVSGDVFTHHQEHLTIYSICAIVYSAIAQFQLIQDTIQQQLG
jgi:hypothetical protein